MNENGVNTTEFGFTEQLTLSVNMARIYWLGLFNFCATPFPPGPAGRFHPAQIHPCGIDRSPCCSTDSGSRDLTEPVQRQ
jgi:hypothetical protein